MVDSNSIQKFHSEQWRRLGGQTHSGSSLVRRGRIISIARVNFQQLFSKNRSRVYWRFCTLITGNRRKNKYCEKNLNVGQRGKKNNHKKLRHKRGGRFNLWHTVIGWAEKKYLKGCSDKAFVYKTDRISTRLNAWCMYQHVIRASLIKLMSNPLPRSVGLTHDRTWLGSGSSWLKITPFGFRKLLKFIKDEYGNPPIYVTENGISERGAVDLNDIHRTYYYKNYINQALKGIMYRPLPLLYRKYQNMRHIYIRHRGWTVFISRGVYWEL